MALGTPALLAGPAYMSNTATNIYTPDAAPISDVITQIHITSVVTTQQTFSLYIGGTGGSAGGTQIESGFTLGPAGSTTTPGPDYDKTFYPGIPLTSTQFLTGQASTTNALVITVVGYKRIIG